MGGPEIAQFLLAGIMNGAIYALVALGFCLVEASTKIVNFTQGDFLTLGGMVMFSLLNQAHLPYPLAFALTIVTVAGVGFLLERLALRPARSKDVLTLVFITIGASIFLRGIIKLTWGKEPHSLPGLPGREAISLLGATTSAQGLWILAITGAIVLGLHLFFSRSLWGKAIRAVASNRQAASLVGIPVSLMIAGSFALAGALGAAAGVLITPITTVSFDTGVVIGLKGFAAAVLGGYGHFGGAILGGIVLGVSETIAAGFISSALKDAIAFVVLLLVLFFRPQGLLGALPSERA
ncbi:branched-chain amino acid ABC transporter permease [Thermosulfuriphilus ammonigenes]|uniref:Branched-chain amino acid ABC transporter permease n=1 Tax=Thermosulfuriphilus ammonigenes TaxID=1936021 RepID=A0A6G7PY66_9BACT|nr:branched-chain amino acid ABC transporter permease [Thermosulfuriphilus ammonigenes]MBA2849494.1 branched-chain amino acid transport system permease protein [Thermosulfuriphilus ammonigenes]QIJ72560.1 branched-chain amino acid ABC transporter permease [Thermosulfuriphilus ammonigenes]